VHSVSLLGTLAPYSNLWFCACCGWCDGECPPTSAKVEPLGAADIGVLSGLLIVRVDLTKLGSVYEGNSTEYESGESSQRSVYGGRV
jgi:hypothetical protein